jgi:hypothetical protein
MFACFCGIQGLEMSHSTREREREREREGERGRERGDEWFFSR